MALSVTHIVRQYLPSIGGMEEVVRNIARQQLAAGQRVRIVTLDRLFRNSSEKLPARELIDGIEVIRLSYIGSSRYPLCPQVLGALGDSQVIHVHGVDFFYDYLAATCWLHKRPLLLSTHGGFFHTAFASRAKQLYFNSITRLSARAYERIVATSRNDGELFQPIVAPGQLQVIENGVDVDKFANCASQTLRPCLIYFGRWSANKGLLETLDWFAGLRAQAPQQNWQLIIAGREYDLSAADLAQRLRAMGLEDCVSLVANPDNTQLCELLARASYFICLSRHEGFGLAPLEAMSAGLTPILSDIPPFRQLLEQSGLGLGFSTTDKGAGSRAQSQLLALHRQGESAYLQRRSATQSFAQAYAWPQVAARYMSLYQQLAEIGQERDTASDRKKAAEVKQ